MSTTQDDAEPSHKDDWATTKSSRRPTILSIDDVNRYASDGRLLRLLREDPVDSFVRETVARELIRYGLGTLVPKMAGGGLLALMRSVGVHQLPTIPQLNRMRSDAGFRQELAYSATGDAFMRFEAQIRAGRGWTETSRQGIGSYFVGGAVFELAGLLRSDRRRDDEFRKTDSLDQITDDDRRFSVADAPPILEVEVINRVFVARTVREIEHEDDRQLVFYKALKYTEREIAETIGRTPKAVERRWARLKRQYPWLARIG